MSKHSTHELGVKGEEEAIVFLEERGYKILQRNYRKYRGEIDIIAKDNNTLCFIEVKTHHVKDFGSPLEAVTKQKQRQITRLALYYLQEHNLKNPKVRFDVVAIDQERDAVKQLQLIKNAFDASPA